MPMPFLAVPLYADVPNVPGVPALLRSVVFPALPFPAAAVASALGLDQFFQAPQWGIFGDGVAIVGDSVAGLDFRKEYRISNYPVEDGGFQSFDKVATPFDARVRFTVGGSDATRAQFLAAVDAAVDSLDLYSIVTPEVVYPSANVVHYDYRREARNGATLLTVDVWVEEVRVTATAQFTNTQAPSGADAANDGTVVPAQGTSAATAVM